jgi:hypothetical protein
MFSARCAGTIKTQTDWMLLLTGTAHWNFESLERGVEFPDVLIHTRGMTERWNERLRCSICGGTGVASVSQRDTDDTATIEDVPEGFKVVATEHGPNFYCTICEVPAEP